MSLAFTLLAQAIRDGQREDHDGAIAKMSALYDVVAACDALSPVRTLDTSNNP